ncbi:hypothetical protein ACIA03_05315 [Nocardioides sp. NPDC051685]|uniref:hypothetical protein n=1 Tax=Nocardioides sp. NPDC051685 TaxID=3364334 RepID=UPI00378E8455
MSAATSGDLSVTLDWSGITVDRSVEMPGSSMIAPLVEFLKDPVRILGSLYSWLGWPTSTLCIAAVWFTERPTTALARTPWISGLGSQVDEVRQLIILVHPNNLALVSILVLTALPICAAFARGWNGVDYCIELVAQRYRPAVVTFWLITLVSLEAHPTSIYGMLTRLQHAAVTLAGLAWRPLVLVLVLALLAAVAVVITAHEDDERPYDELFEEVLDDWLPRSASVLGSVVVGLGMMLILAAVEVLANPVRILSFCVGLIDVRQETPGWSGVPIEEWAAVDAQPSDHAMSVARLPGARAL